MQPRFGIPSDLAQAGFKEETWRDVLDAVDRTYTELVEYQERLEARNNELRALRRFLASIMGSISDFLIVVERDGTISNASTSFCSAVALGIDDLIGRDIGMFFDGKEREKMNRTILGVIQLRQEITIEAELSTAQGADPVEFWVAPRLDRRRKGAGAVLTGRPLGELRRAYGELEKSLKILKETQGQLVRNEKLASLGRLLAGVAHELNNPISFVYANTHSLEKYVNRFETYFERVQQGATREELMDLRKDLKLERGLKNLRLAIDGARDGAERVRDIVNDLRRISADGSGEMIVFDLAETARIAAKWIKRGGVGGLRFVFSGDAPCLAIGRPGHIQQVLMNLIQNAVDATKDEPEPVIRIGLCYQGDMAKLEIEDNGPGVPGDAVDAIFDPFFTTKGVGQGTGLGLSISHKIVEEHKGALVLHQKAGAGACFHLSLQRGDRT